MSSKQFLVIGGVLLLLLAIVGFVEGDAKLLGDLLWFDTAENVLHLVLGVVALAAAYTLPANLQRWLVLIVGIAGILGGLVGVAVADSPPPNLGPANLENPLDNLLHIVVGIWALAVALRGRVAAAQPA